MIESNYSQTPSPIENAKPKKLFFLIGGIVVLALVTGLIVFLVQKKNTTKILNPIQESTVLNASTTVAEVTSTPFVEPYPNDLDRDGIDDQKEKEMGLSNRDFDTDGDGLSDGDEIGVWKTDPQKVDSDGDAFSDAYEVMKGYNPAGLGKLPVPQESTSTPQ